MTSAQSNGWPTRQQPDSLDNWAGRGFSMPASDTYPVSSEAELTAANERLRMEHSEELAARQFFKELGIDDPTPDAIAQLLVAFMPSLRIMCERGYDRNGLTWRASGWRGQIQEMRKKMDRLWLRGWLKGNFDPDSARDMINYAGFYLRLGGQGKPWADWGEPGSEGE
jgi:hypothetical protein